MQNSVQYTPFVKDDENKGFDMHVHTTVSDGRTTPKTLAKYLNKNDLFAAITDHNVISGIKEALDYSENIIPGIEVSALEGPHVLVYFDTYRDLASYYTSSIQDHCGKCPHMAVNISTEKIITDAKDAGGLVIAAHPYGYGVSVRGVMKGIDVGIIDPAVAEELDGLEVICSGMSVRNNLRAERYAEKKGVCMTGVGCSRSLGSGTGSDGRICRSNAARVSGGGQREKNGCVRYHPILRTESADGGMYDAWLYSICSAGDDDPCTAELDEDEILVRYPLHHRRIRTKKERSG